MLETHIIAKQKADLKREKNRTAQRECRARKKEAKESSGVLIERRVGRPKKSTQTSKKHNFPDHTQPTTVATENHDFENSYWSPSGTYLEHHTLQPASAIIADDTPSCGLLKGCALDNCANNDQSTVDPSTLQVASRGPETLFSYPTGRSHQGINLAERNAFRNQRDLDLHYLQRKQLRKAQIRNDAEDLAITKINTKIQISRDKLEIKRLEFERALFFAAKKPIQA